MEVSLDERKELEDSYCTFLIAFFRNRLRAYQKHDLEKIDRYKYEERQMRSLWHIKSIVRRKIIPRERIRELNKEVYAALEQLIQKPGKSFSKAAE